MKTLGSLLDSQFQILLLMIGSAFFAATGFIMPLWAEFTQQLGGGNLKTAGIAVAIYSMSFGLFAFLFGLVTSYFRQNKLFLCTSYLLYSVLCTAYLFVYTPMQLYCVQLLIAVAAAMQSPVRNALYNKTITNGKETIGWGLYNLTFTFSIGLGAMIGSHLAHYFGFNWVFIGMSVMGMTAFFLTLIFA